MDIDTPILRELKELQEAEGTSLSRLVSDLLSEALGRRRRGGTPSELVWRARDLRPLVDVGDKEALHAALDRDDG